MRRHAATACVLLLASLLAGCRVEPFGPPTTRTYGRPCGLFCLQPIVAEPLCTRDCFEGQVCDVDTNTCRSLCQPTCAATEFCQVVGGKANCATLTCAYPSAWDANVQKISMLQISDVTTGCDLDGDGKPNNVLGKLVSLYKDANTQMAKSIADGTTVLLLEAGGYATDKRPFSVRWLYGVFDKQPACDPTTSTCEYTIAPESYDRTSPSGVCPARLTFANAEDDAGTLSASSDTQQLRVVVPFVAMSLALRISKPSLQGTTSGVATWESTKSGMICGYVTKDDLNTAIDAVPPDVLAQIGDAATVKSLVAGILKPDIATTPGGPKDALSAAFDFETIPAHVTGMAQP